MLERIKAHPYDYLYASKVVGHDWDSAAALYLEECAKRGARLSTLRGYKSQILKAQNLLRLKDVSLLSAHIANDYLASIKSLCMKTRLPPSFCKSPHYFALTILMRFFSNIFKVCNYFLFILAAAILSHC